jgi:hypothetical protein
VICGCNRNVAEVPISLDTTIFRNVGIYQSERITYQETRTRDFGLFAYVSDRSTFTVSKSAGEQELGSLSFCSRFHSYRLGRYSTFEKKRVAVLLGCQMSRGYLNYKKKKIELHCYNLAWC